MVEYIESEKDKELNDKLIKPAVEVKITAAEHPFMEEPQVRQPVKAGKWTFTKVLALVLAGALTAGGAAGVGYRLSGGLGSGERVDGAYYLESESIKRVSNEFNAEKTIPSIVKELGPAIVSITSKITTSDFFFNSYESEGSGTGVVFNINKDSILIVTNNHVVENANSLLVAFNDTDSAIGEIVGVDPDADLAVLKVKKSDVSAEVLSGLNPVVLGNSDDLEVGELAIAIGNPLGYSDTVTVGFISGIDRMLNMSGRNFNLIQTDAAINPGNSGGALVNARGEVIGINTIKISSTQVEGIGFAIPINTVKPIVAELIEKGYVSRPYLGIAGRDITDEISELYDLPVGVMVRDVVPQSGASEAGIMRGDIITALDGKEVKNMNELILMISGYQVGQTVTLSVTNDAIEREVEVVLKDKNAK
ncbi:MULTISPECIES: S1C family serine protease [unclassified Fusibacter]|uniref:S1C family serine protease n=1 Tax=unclassified Fusibacter TaxID=2624464 RepID=UPI0013E93651|nr:MULTISPECIES: trypsin-like peptidase domain-containing protein [unclassified Fusibacter]MCK8059645.1 trypsin-like peptidase domain-containing protein [Fusibacter sp. A2]NPE21446.1 trypsin-like serine protease [Fusibacter sp. A1]